MEIRVEVRVRLESGWYVCVGGYHPDFFDLIDFEDEMSQLSEAT